MPFDSWRHRVHLLLFTDQDFTVIPQPYEEIKRELKRILRYECRCNERLKTKPEVSTRLVYNGLRGGLEHPKIETKLIDERFESVMGECVRSDLETIGAVYIETNL